MTNRRNPDRRRRRAVGAETSANGQLGIAPQIAAVDARQQSADERDRVADERDREADQRDNRADERDNRADVRDRLADARDTALDDRDRRVASRELLIGQMRDANEQLVLASVREAEAAEVAAVAREFAEHSEERFRSLVTAAATIVWQADADGALYIDSKSWKDFTGVDMEMADPRWGWLEAVHPKDRANVRDAWTRALSTSTPYLVQHRLRHRDGDYVWVVSRAVPIIKNGLVREWIGMMTDVTDHVRIEEAREQFIGILGHDLRNPLQAILVGAALLSELPAPYASVVAKIVRSGHRMETIIRDVMDFARGRLGGGIPVKLGPCDLGRICRDVVAEMRQAYPGRNIGLELVGDLHCECDNGRIEQVLSNLLGNAIVHGTDPIRVRVQEETASVVLSVENQGTPIPSALLPRLFEPFSQGPRIAASRKDIEGVGLGLYIVSEIVRAHGGTVTVSSVQSEGTTFFARLPRNNTPRC